MMNLNFLKKTLAKTVITLGILSMIPTSQAEASVLSLINCLREAKTAELSGEDASNLCQYAQSVNPVRCFKAAILQLKIAKDAAIALCNAAPSPLAPVFCFKTVQRNMDGYLSDAQIATSCTAITD